ncbi:uncharacterized protein LOC124271266 [Haliotis rubra]|uniref:uncharacterized protein LOC124271266 n=1 Tax=Haliotis rubra TaxID=36100 RepID=UPI001EE57761|nr:uncharacterized protein LOC124271266 [Haliotis rubra]
MRGSTVISDDVLLNTVELTAEDADGSTFIQHYHLTGSTRNQSVTLLIDSLLTRLNDQQQCSCTVVSHSVGEARLLILLMNIASRLMDDGRVDVIRNMRRLQSSLGGPLSRRRMSAYVWSSPSDDWNLQFMSTHKNITLNRCIISTYLTCFISFFAHAQSIHCVW